MSPTPLDHTYRFAKRVVIAVIGGTMLLAGVIMLITPGPGLVVIAAALTLLAVEFAWARVWLAKVRRKVSEAGAAMRARASEQHRD
ncbi:MAG: PGPGW domain-containing protein [Pseudomonadota bacterium]